VGEANSPRGLAKPCQCLRRPGTVAGLLGKFQNRALPTLPPRRAAISSLLVCRFCSWADLELEGSPPVLDREEGSPNRGEA
jgi:hypothetical protein